jgi:hypothetical protein
MDTARFLHWRSAWCVLGAVLLSASAAAQPELALTSLTVPSASLPEGCALATQTEPPRAPVVTTGVVHVSANTQATLPSNPWSGSDPSGIQSIWPAVVPSESLKLRPLPDGFPRDKREALARRQRVWDEETKRSEGLKEAYRAKYVTPYGTFATVSAVRFTDAARATASTPVPFIQPQRPTRFLQASIAAVVTGTLESPCFEAVRTHVQRILR